MSIPTLKDYVAGTLKQQKSLCSDNVKIILDFIENDDFFEAVKWKKHFGVDVEQQGPIPNRLYTFLNKPDPIDPSQNARDTHVVTFRPEFVKLEDCSEFIPYNLKIIGKLAGDPKEGFKSGYVFEDSPALLSNQAKGAGPSCWLAMRKTKGVFARGRDFNTQKQYMRRLNETTGAGYEEEPSAIDLATVLFTRYVSTGKAHLRSFWKNGRLRGTYSRCKETFLDQRGVHQVSVGGFMESSGLSITKMDTDENLAILGLKKFIQEPESN